MARLSRGAVPHVWAHLDRYFVTGEVIGLAPDVALAICVSRWSPRHDWQVIKFELRDLTPDKYDRIAPPIQRVERRPKAQLVSPRRVRSGWFPDESELVRLHPLSPLVFANLGHEMRSLISHHVLAYDLVEEADADSPDHVVARTARRYRQLANVGETSPAAAIAEATSTSVRTVHNRLRIARERGLLPHLGQGARRAAEPIPPTVDDLRLVAGLVSTTSPGSRLPSGNRNRAHRSLRPRGRAPLRKD